MEVILTRSQNFVRSFYFALIFASWFAMAACGGSSSSSPAVVDGPSGGVTLPIQASDQVSNGSGSLVPATLPITPATTGVAVVQPVALDTTAVQAAAVLPVQAPKLQQTLNGGLEGWLSSPAVVDLDRDGYPEIIAARDRVLYVWHSDGTLFWKGATSTVGRIWGPPVVGDFDGDGRLEVAVGSHQEKISVFQWNGVPKPGWPKLLGGTSEIRSIAAGVISPGKLGLLVARSFTKPVGFLFDATGKLMPGWPQLSSSGGCSPKVNCFEAGTYNQNVGIADLNGDGKNDMIISYDHTYVGAYSMTGVPFPTAPIFKRHFFNGIPAFHSLALAIQGWGPDGVDRSEFADSPPVVADLDGDGKRELILAASHFLAGGTTNLGNALFVYHADATRQLGFEFPFETGGPLVYPDPGANILDVQPSPAVADLDRDGKKEIIFPSFDGNMYAVRSNGKLMWKFSFAGNGARFASEPVIADLNNDGYPEVLFTTYETTAGKGAIIILDRFGKKLAQTALPGRGAMAAPTLADVYRNGELEVIVNLKDNTPQGGIQIYNLPGAKTNQILWATGRGNYLRNGDATH